LRRPLTGFRATSRPRAEIHAPAPSPNAIAPAPASFTRRVRRRVARSMAVAPLPSVTTACVPSGVIASARAGRGSRIAARGRSVAASMMSSARPRVA
jgi:hypothetical protein